MRTRIEVLNELLEYSKSNNGKTPSEKVFYENTGIGIYDLHKLGWSNYGELVREAHLQPNLFDKTKYNTEQLCEIFIGVIREKRKFPTRGDLDVKHHSDTNFPDSSTFYKKLGLKNKLADTILSYIQDKKDYEDVIVLCNKVLEDTEEDEGSSEIENMIHGFVYLGKQHGDYKIGKTIDKDRRREDITLLGSEPFVEIHVIETDDMDGVEKYWHDRFKVKQKRGEWFNLSLSDIKAFKRWKKIF